MKGNKKKLSNLEAKNDKSKSKLDALMMDSDAEESKGSSADDDVNFEEFMSEYRKSVGHISDNEKDKPNDDNKDPQEEFLKSQPKSKQKKSKESKQTEKNKSRSDWNEEITLMPEEYEDLDDGSGISESPIEEDPAPDFNLGSVNDDSEEKFQLSINFEGEHISETADEEEKPDKYDPEKPRLIDWLYDLTEMLVVVLTVVIVLNTFVFKHSVVDGDSMNNTLNTEEHLIISDLFYTPKPGDIIVFEDYSTSLEKAVVKRVIAIEGDRVEISSNSKGTLDVFVNDKLLEEDYAYYNLDLLVNSDYKISVTVPEGKVFVMGDNRYDSKDSRHIGPVDIDSILGKVILRFYPFDKFGTVK